MARLRQFYDGAGVPLTLDREEDAPAKAWRAHRARLRAWLDSLPESEWSGPTRCALWDVTALALHLVSGSQFLGYTLHQAHKGVSTALMKGFDTHETVQAAAATFNDLTPGAARRILASMDASVEVECGHAADCGWLAMAEAPPGTVPTHVAVNHFLLDSWVHEYDFMMPRGETPPADRLEAELVVSYLVGLGSLETGSQISLDLRLANPDIRIGLEVIEEKRHVTVGSAPRGAAAIEGDVVDLVDRATGRECGPVHGDREAVAVLDAFGDMLAR